MKQSLEYVDPSPFDVDSAYLRQTLRHEPMELGLDDSVSLMTLGFLLLRAFLSALIVFVAIGIVGAILGSVAGSDVAFFLIDTVGSLASFATFWVVLLVPKVTEPIGEWRTLLADRAGQADSYYRLITAVLMSRRLPITPQFRSVQLNSPARPVKHIIVLEENEYQAYVTVFPYGTSLYAGWQMWRQRAGAALIRRALLDWTKSVSPVTTMLRTDRARAMREAVHLACREAIYTTADQNLQAQAQQMPMPQIEQESGLLVQQPASPNMP